MSPDDQLIWSLNSGDVLMATRDLLMEGSGERAFTEGKTYVVVSMHPIADPPRVRVIDDQGKLHWLYGEHLRRSFYSR